MPPQPEARNRIVADVARAPKSPERRLAADNARFGQLLPLTPGLCAPPHPPRRCKSATRCSARVPEVGSVVCLSGRRPLSLERSVSQRRSGTKPRISIGSSKKDMERTRPAAVSGGRGLIPTARRSGARAARQAQADSGGGRGCAVAALGRSGGQVQSRNMGATGRRFRRICRPGQPPGGLGSGASYRPPETGVSPLDALSLAIGPGRPGRGLSMRTPSHRCDFYDINVTWGRAKCCEKHTFVDRYGGGISRGLDAICACAWCECNHAS